MGITARNDLKKAQSNLIKVKSNDDDWKEITAAIRKNIQKATVRGDVIEVKRQLDIDKRYTYHHRESARALKRAEKACASALKRYENTPLGKLEKTYKNVKRKIENLFD